MGFTGSKHQDWRIHCNWWIRASLSVRARPKAWSIDSCDNEIESGAEGPLAQPIDFNGRRIGNRFCVHPMEGWDGTADGRPTDATLRRWKHFGLSGAKLIWGGEAVAVRHDGRANPNQLLINNHTKGDLALLRDTLVAAHHEAAAS